MPERRLKILQVVPYFYPAWAYGGIPRAVYDLTRELARQGHDVTVYTTDVLDKGSRYVPVKSELGGVKIHYFKNLSNHLAYEWQLFLPRGLVSSVTRSIGDFDIIHLHGHRHLLNSAVHHFATKLKKPYVFSGHGTVPRIERRLFLKTIFDKIFGGRVLRDAAAFIAVSESEVNQYKEMGIERKKVKVIHNGVDAECFSKLPDEGTFKKRYGLGNKRVILYLGKITPRKGLDFLVKAFAELKRPETALVVAGNDMGFKRKVKELIMERELEGRVVFTGLLTGAEKLAAYRDADLLVYPAIHEVFGLVPFEALMCDTPVIVADDCGCGQIIGGEGIGYIVRYNDVRDLTNKMENVLLGGDDAERTVKRGKEFIKKELQWEDIAKRHVGLYRELIP